MDNPTGCPPPCFPRQRAKKSARTQFCVTRRRRFSKKALNNRSRTMVTRRLTPNGKPDNEAPGRIIVPSGGQVIAAPEKFQRLFDEAQAMEREDAWQSGATVT